MTCKGICTRYKAHKEAGNGRYSAGQSRCQICEIFIKIDGLWCPCCGYRLRKKPRNLKFKAKLRANQKPIEGLQRASLEDAISPLQVVTEPEPSLEDQMWLHDCTTAKMIISTYGPQCIHCKITRKEAEAA